MRDMLAQNGPYRVSLLAGDLEHEELIHQVAESLDQLKVVIDDVFLNVQRKITANKTRLSKIDERMRLAQLKVDKLKGRKKATQVFSSAKYPGEETHTYHSMFAQKDSAAFKKHSHYRMKNRQHLPPTDQNINDKHKFYSVKVGRTSSADLSSEGLGRLPHNIDSISSLLLFNTSENPYKKYVMLDPRGVVTKMRAMGNEESFGPADAPATIALGEEAISQKQETYIYRPDLGEVPMISVPDTLPDLLDVADDMIYGADTGPSIAPSVFSQLDLPELPAVVDDTTPKDTPAQVGGSAPPPPPPPSSAAPPPPPPPAAAPPPPPPAAAPPPPPPAPAAPVDAPPPPAAEAAPTQSSGGGGDGGRGDLLDAIRNAGGAGKAKLKKASERKVERKKEKEVKSSGGGGGLDLFAEMTNKILLRRQGIAGFKGAAKQANEKPSEPPVSDPPTGMMSKMSELIPYNPANESKDDDDDEWDD